jgi:hypothetical protein
MMVFMADPSEIDARADVARAGHGQDNAGERNFDPPAGIKIAGVPGQDFRSTARP